LLTT